jgi:hypothetical protein
MHLEGLDEGEYAWQVRGRNPSGIGPWSSSRAFSVVDIHPTPPSTISVPYTDTMEITTTIPLWTATSLWHLVDDNTLAKSGSHSWWYQGSNQSYDTGQPNAGDLTSPTYEISAAGHYYLRFFYRYTTESQGPRWDQRWVQVSIDGGPFRNAWQLTDDPMSAELDDPYLTSKVLDLGTLGTGQTVRIRFHFETLDAIKNGFEGWTIDDLNIITAAPDTCADINEPNDTWQQAPTIAYTQTVNASICPPGDFDYYRFNASAGDQVAIDIDAAIASSSLDPYLYLLDSDGVSVLAENDDEVFTVLIDPFLTFQMPHNGTYYLKVRAWDNPRAGGSKYTYTIRLFNDKIDPTLVFPAPPTTNGYLPNQTINLTALVSDTQSGVAYVDFYWHDNDWERGKWKLLYSDTDGANGWNTSFNPTAQPEQKNLALYVNAYDRARNMIGSGHWNLGIDRTLPVTALGPISATQTSTAFALSWTGSDNLSGLDHYELQWNVDNSGWQAYPATLTALTQKIWMIVQAGHNYAFRLRGVDVAGNQEAFTTTAETSTTIPATICSAPDSWETDNTSATAKPISFSVNQIHNFCNPLTPDKLNDVDWITITVRAGQRYLIQVTPLAENAAATISLYTSDGVTLTLQAEATPTDFGQSTWLEWFPSKSEIAYIRLRHPDGRVAGNTVAYEVRVVENYPVYLPVVRR